jgi:cytochrome P450
VEGARLRVGFAAMQWLSGVFSAEGADWKRQRRLVATALNTNHLHRYFHVVRTSTERLHRRLTEAAHSGRALDITEELTSYTCRRRSSDDPAFHVRCARRLL